MTAVLTHSNYEETLHDFIISGGRLFHANGPATEKLRGPKPAVIVCDTTRSL